MEDATSLPFPALITDVCQTANVLVDHRKDKMGMEAGIIDINRLGEAVVPPVVVVQEDLPSSQPSVTPQTDAAESSTPQVVPTSTTAQDPPITPAISRLGILAQHVNAKVDQLRKTLPNVIKQALTPVQAVVTDIQQKQSVYAERLKGIQQKPSIIGPPQLELKHLPAHLWYKFLGSNDTLPVIVLSSLNDLHVDRLLEVLRDRRQDI